MNFMLALNVTIYGLGIVFLALLVLMVAIMLLTKVFSMATGKDLLAVPAPSAPEAAPPPATVAEAPLPATPTIREVAEPVIAPLPGKILSVAVQAGNQVRRGDELCVIEAMKMGNSVKAPRDGVVAEVCVAAGDTVIFGAPLVLLASTGAAAPRIAPRVAAPAAPPTTPVGTSSLMLTVAGASHAVDVAVGATGAATVRLGGSSYQVQRDRSDGKKFIVNGTPHVVEVKDMVGTSATVLVDGVPQKIDVARRAPAAPLSLSLSHAGTPHTIEVRSGEGGASTVLVDGSAYQVEQDRAEPTRILVNGQAHTVNVKEMAGTAATVLIDGRTERLEIARGTATGAPPTAPPAEPTAAAPPHAGRPAAGERVTAPLPGKVLSVAVKPGDGVHKGDELCVIEAMKMGNSIRAQRDGTVRQVLVAPGQTVAFGASLLELD